MREELLALFRDTERAPASPTPPASMLPEEGGSTTQSIFLQRFLRRTPFATDLPSAGIPDLDARLGGGLIPGLHLLAGSPGAGKTVFLLSAVWEAVSAQRPAVYYAFREGSLRAWMRLIATLAGFQSGAGEPPVTLTALRNGRLDPGQVELLGRLDLVLARSVMPLLSLVDAVPARMATLDAFVEDVRARSREVGQRRFRVPLVLVDDLDRLLLLAPGQPLVHALAILDEVLREECVPGLVAAGLPESLLPAMDSLPAQTVLDLENAVGTLEDGFGRAALQVRANAVTGWRGSVPLLLDFSSGLFTSDPTEGIRTSPK
jgi:hypothetical protein